MNHQQKKFIKLLVCAILGIYLAIACFSILFLKKSEVVDLTGIQEIQNLQQSNSTVKDGASKVYVGLYLDGLETLSIRDSSWTGTFYIWFRWKGDDPSNPAKTFQIIDAKIEKKELQDSYTGPGQEHYECYKVVAKFANFFSSRLVPLDRHVIHIRVEDSALQTHQLIYVADDAANINPKLVVPGYQVLGFRQSSVDAQYPTNYGDPRIAHDRQSAYSQLDYAFEIKRLGLGFFLKLFFGMYAGVFLALCSFFLRPSETAPRYGLPSAAYFGAIGNTYLVNSLIPPSGQFGLPDLISGIGFFTIALSVVITLTSTYFYLRKDEKVFSKKIDGVSCLTIGICYVLVNVLILNMVA